MSNFNRGISNPDFIAVLNEEYKSGGWWRQIVDDRDLFIAIRNEYINVYYKGNSLFKISYNGNLVAETHYKYLVRPDAEPFLVKASNGTSFAYDANQYAIRDLNEIDSIKKASSVYSGIEKEGIQKIIQSNDNIIDLEIALTNEALRDEMEPDTEKKRSTAKRIDFAALQKKDELYEVVFFEAKHFSNKELRAQEKAKVLEQIDTYKELLSQYKDKIIGSYKRVCRNFSEILPDSRCAQDIVDIAQGKPLNVDLQPRLVVFGFDGDQQNGAYWEKHKTKLMEGVGTQNFLAKGDPSEFTNGIAKPKK